MNKTTLLQLFLLLLIFQTSIYAQGISEPLPQGDYEIGYSHYWYKGDFYWNPATPSFNDTWNNGTFYFRMGVYDILSLAVEFMVWPVNSASNYPGEAFLNYTLGMTLSSTNIRILFFDAYVNIHYLQNTYLDQSDQKKDKRFSNMVISVPFRYQFYKRYAIWIAPAYNWNESDYFEDQTYSRLKDSAGIIFGADALFFKHIYLNLNVIYTDYFLPNIVAGYRF
jgi:hypothetical protein